jgi:hypothetical protein
VEVETRVERACFQVSALETKTGARLLSIFGFNFNLRPCYLKP